MPTGRLEAFSDGVPVTYGVNLLLAAAAYFVLVRAIVRVEGRDSALRRVFGRDVKGRLSPGLYLLGIGLTFVAAWIAVAVYFVVAAMWLVPDRRVERYVVARGGR